LSIISTEAGMTIELSEEQLEITNPSIRVSFEPGWNAKAERDIHREKHNLPIVVTDDGMTIDHRPQTTPIESLLAKLAQFRSSLELQLRKLHTPGEAFCADRYNGGRNANGWQIDTTSECTIVKVSQVRVPFECHFAQASAILKTSFTDGFNRGRNKNGSQLSAIHESFILDQPHGRA
jgi:hypothetical protein